MMPNIRRSQIDAFTQNTTNKNEQKNYNDFATILKKNMQNTNKENEQLDFYQGQMSRQNEQIQQAFYEQDFQLPSDNSQSKLQKRCYESQIQNINDIDIEFTQPQETPMAKKTVKKSGKRDFTPLTSQQKRNQKTANKKKRYEMQVAKKVIPNFKKDKQNNQADLSDLLQIRPQIKIYQDKRLKQTIFKSMAEDTRLKEANFVIEIPESIQWDQILDLNNKLLDSQAIEKYNLSSPNKLNKLQSNQKKQDFNILAESNVKQVQQLKQSKTKERTQNSKNKTKFNLQNDLQQIQLIRMKQSKSKNSTRQVILKASMASEKATEVSKNDQDLYIRNNRKMVNLAEVSLKELVKELYIKKIINQGLYKQFIQNHSIKDLKDYIKKFDSLKLHQFDFKTIKFTILDHRKIAELLANLHSDRYVLGESYHPDPQINIFLSKVYELDAQQYYNLYKKIDNISGLKWWSKILIMQDQRLMQINKERRMNRRKAEQASLAVQALIQNAKKQALDNSIAESYVKGDNKGKDSSAYSGHTTFFGQSEEQKVLSIKRRQQIRELAQIRQLVSNNFSSKTNKNQQGENKKPTMRKKIKFY